jgi:hypothetical protein
LSLAEVATELAKLPTNRVPERADWAKLSAGWTARIRDRIAELERLQAGLTECIGCGCLSLDRCRLANPAIGQRAVARAPLLDGGGRATRPMRSTSAREEYSLKILAPMSSPD